MGDLPFVAVLSGAALAMIAWMSSGNIPIAWARDFSR